MSGKDSITTVVLYGAFPPDSTPRTPDIYPNPIPIPAPFVPVPMPAALAPCPVCNRHIYGSLCPFCFAEQIAKAPSRAALEAVKKSLEEALRIVNEALK